MAFHQIVCHADSFDIGRLNCMAAYIQAELKRRKPELDRYIAEVSA
jgi:hypothetical protein